MFRKLSAIFLSLVILVVWVGNVSAVAEEYPIQEIEVTTVENPYNKLHFYFSNEEHAFIDSSSELQEAVNSIVQNTNVKTRSGAPTDSEITVTVEFTSDFMSTPAYKDFAKERENIDSIEDLRDFRHRLNEYSKAYHDNLISKNLSSVDLLDYKECEVIGYSPFVTITMDVYDVSAESLHELCEMSNVKNISLSDEAYAEDEASWDQTLNAINAYDIVNDGTYTGEHIRIGVYELNGICDTTHANLIFKDITVRDYSVGISDHATNVTSILAIMAPDAEFYVSKVDGEGISWFIEQGCDIVNCSFGYLNVLAGYRYDIDGLYDYQISTHFITVCKSAGNISSSNPNGVITSPGYAYNVVTVGGVNLDDNNRWVWASGSCYYSYTPQVKPNVAAPFVVNIPNVGEGGGTSYSSPLVVGSLALLMDGDYRYCVYPERVLSLLASTSRKNYDYEDTICDFDDKTGAGIIDLERMIDSYIYSVEYNDDHTPGKRVITLSEYLSAGTNIQIGLAWLVTIYSEVEGEEEICVTDYDLQMFDSSGNIMHSSTLSKSNVEMLRISISKNDTYKIVVYQWSEMSQNVDMDWMAITYTYD